MIKAIAFGRAPRRDYQHRYHKQPDRCEVPLFSQKLEVGLSHYVEDFLRLRQVAKT